MIAPTWRHAMALAVASLGALAFVLEFAGAAAQDLAPAKRAVSRHAPGEANGQMIPKGSIRVANRDRSTLVSVLLSNDGFDPDVVAQNVPSGVWVIVALPKPDVCVYDVEARFEDWSWITVPSFDLCKDRTLNIGDALPIAEIKPFMATPAAPAASAKTEAALRPSGEEKLPVESKVRIRIENDRHSTLLSLSLAVRGETPHVVTQIVASGASVTVALPEAGKCVYDVKGEFADNYGTSLPGFDLCKDPTLKFAE